MNPKKGIKEMNDKTKEPDPTEIDDSELENIIAGMPVRSGVRAGIQPCL